MIRRLLKNDFAFSAFNQVLAFIIALGVSVFMNRYMGSSVKGEYTYWISMINVISLVLGMGLYHSYAYNKRKGVENITQKYVNMFSLQFLLLSAAAAVATAVFGNPLFSVLAFSVPLNVLSTNLLYVLTIESGRFRYTIRTAYAGMQLVQMAVLFFGMESSVVWMFVMQIVRNGVFIAIYQWKLGCKPKPFDIDKKFIVATIVFGSYPMLATLLQTLNYRVDVFMLKGQVSPESLGYYAFGATMAEILWLVPNAFRDVLSARTAKDDATDTVILSVKLANSVMLALIALAVVFGKIAIRILFGEEFVPAYSVMLLLFGGVPSMAWYMITGTVFIAQGRRKFFFFVMLGGLIVNVSLNAALIPLLGITGAALTSIVSYTLCGWIFLTAYGKTIGKSVFKLLLLDKGDIRAIYSILKK